MTTTDSIPTTGVRIRTARAADADAFIALTSLINLRIPASELGTALAPIRAALAEEPFPPLTHGLNLFLIAEDAHGTPVGAIHCGTPLWVYEHPRVRAFMRGIIRRRISTIDTLAVHPDHRRKGIGRELVRTAEQKFTESGYTVLTLRHSGLEDYYGPLGYTSANRLIIDLPPLGRITQTNKGWSFAVKPLTSDVSHAVVPGYSARVVTGALTGTPLRNLTVDQLRAPLTRRPG